MANPKHDALRHATATTLREWAATSAAAALAIARVYTDHGAPVPDDLTAQLAHHRGLASLAEAVAKLDDHTLACLVSRMGREVYVASDSDKVIRAESLPAALAAMLDAEGA